MKPIQKLPSFFLIFMTTNFLNAQTGANGLFENHTDIGPVKLKGTVQYIAETDEYYIEGSGSNIWFESDEFHYGYRKIKGDFILTAQVAFIGQGVDPHRKSGWMIRQNLDNKAPHVSAVVHGDGLTSLQYRKTSGNNMEEIRSLVAAPDVVQIERKGNLFIMSIAKYGETFSSIEKDSITLGDEVYIGLFLCSHNADVLEKAQFHNVRITQPATPELVPYKDYLSSSLEVLDIESGRRSILHQYRGSFQAPNWTQDGKDLIYNQEGLLYSFNLKTRSISLLNTGIAKSNNNDHVLSFDGKWIGISDHTEDENHQSIIYVVPSKGGNARRVTPLAPSYLHGWSPDGKHLVYTGGRNGNYDIYKISVKGGEEIRLTDNPGLDDGSEYSPDGRFIYFNSNRTGLMQIWRMKPDGSDQVQITRDGWNDWFPHISPDGKWIVMISYDPKEVASGDHPFYKHVYLRLMPVEGGKPRVIAYLYGGQGTINVPSWSPDSKKVAFVSNGGVIRETK